LREKNNAIADIGSKVEKGGDPSQVQRTLPSQLAAQTIPGGAGILQPT
jgi:hypothetical protein